MFLARGLRPEFLAKFPDEVKIGNGLLLSSRELLPFVAHNNPDFRVEEYDPNATHNISRKIVAQHPAAFVRMECKTK